MRRLTGDRALLVVWGLMAVWAGVFAWLSVLRYRTFSTGRFDLGNMVQAVWSTSEGRLFQTTDVSGKEFNRLGAHVDPILALFTPLWMMWSSPEVLLVAQAVIVATGALPAFWLGRRWLRDDRLAVAAAAVYLLYPGLQHSVLFDFHPVTLAAPLLLFCIWAAEEGRWWTLGVCAALAALSQEQVGVMLATLAVWMAVRHPDRRRAAAVLGIGGLLWVAIALLVIMPAFAIDPGVNPHVSRYSSLGDGPTDILITFLTRPWDAVAVLITPGRGIYLLALFLPLLLLPFAAPLLAACALPQLLINLFASSGPAQSLQYHYTAVLVPFLVAASILGLANLRDRGVPKRVAERLAPLIARPGLTALLLVGTLVLAGARQGPLPVWSWLPIGWQGSPLHQFSRDDQTRALQQAVGMIPPDAVVSATNAPASHLSARRVIYLFPKRNTNSDFIVVADNRRYRAIAQDRPTLRPASYRGSLNQLIGSPYWKLIYDREGVLLFQRRRPPAITPTPSTPVGRAS
ncbi:MAG: DUF2079 domain-containing protein [Thermoleophilia bacterium]